MAREERCLGLQVSEVSRHFGGLRALDGVSFTLEPGGITAIIGPNGSGKTTLLNVVSGVLGCSHGEVRIGAYHTRGWPSYRVARLGVSRTFQEVRLFREFTVADNVIYALRRGAQEGVADAFRVRHLRRMRDELRLQALDLLAKVGLQDGADQSASALSYGQEKLVELVRALATSPQLLLLDEPTAGLSPSATDMVLNIVGRDLQNAATVVFIEHNLQVVRTLAHRVIVLDAGRAIADGTPDEVLRDPCVREAYFGRRSTPRA